MKVNVKEKESECFRSEPLHTPSHKTDNCFALEVWFSWEEKTVEFP